MPKTTPKPQRIPPLNTAGAKYMNFWWSVFFALAATCFLSHFQRLSGFGFYEDDYWATAPFLGGDLYHAWNLLVEAFQKWPQGRPLNHSLPKIQAIVGYKIAGIEGIYFLAYLGLTINAALITGISRHFISDRGALICGISYVLFPADTTHQFLVHSGHVQGGLTFSLAGAWFFIRGGKIRILAYALAALSLTAYETAFLPFLTLPIFLSESIRKAIKPTIQHLLICGSIIAAYGIIRSATGESRTAMVLGAPLDAAQKVLSSAFLGPATSGLKFVSAPADGFQKADLASLLSALVLLGILVLTWLNLQNEQSPPRKAAQLTVRNYPLIFSACLATWVISYLLTIVNYPPTQTIGRLTSTHTAAAWGMSLLIGTMACWFKTKDSKREIRIGLAMAGAYLIFGNILYSNWIQREYERSWRLQKQFWSQIHKLCPDAKDGWTIIITGSPAATSPVMQTNSWADILTCRALFSMHINYAHADVIGAALNLTTRASNLTWTPEYWAGKEETILETKLILLSSDGTTLRRIQSADIQGFTLKAVPEPLVRTEEKANLSLIAQKLLERP